MKVPNQSASIKRSISLFVVEKVNKAVTPQQRRIDDMLKLNCIPNCVCVSPINCPCCDSLLSLQT